MKANSIITFLLKNYTLMTFGIVLVSIPFPYVTTIIHRIDGSDFMENHYNFELVSFWIMFLMMGASAVISVSSPTGKIAYVGSFVLGVFGSWITNFGGGLVGFMVDENQYGPGYYLIIGAFWLLLILGFVQGIVYATEKALPYHEK